MRIVSWNCQQALHLKKHALATLAPDVAVLCEVPLDNPFEGSLLDPPVTWHAAGPWPKKSLAVAGFRGEMNADGLPEVRGRFGVAVSHSLDFGVLGVWSAPAGGPRYGDEVLSVIDSCADWIAEGDVVVAGDFNIDAHGVANGANGTELFAKIVRRLSDLGLVSAYHTWTGESFGAESRMTHFHRRKPDHGFHIDYCFIPTAWSDRVREVTVGRPDTWLAYSDHMPIMVDLDLCVPAEGEMTP
jgi:hypothetical protein